MQIIKTDGHTLMLDIAEYLESEFSWNNAKWTEEKLICCSPFRDERHPSFYVNLDNDYSGFFGDSGSGERGNLVMLVSLLRDVAYEEALEELVELFEPQVGKQFNLVMDLREPVRNSYVETVQHSKSEYLLNRGISFETQEVYGTAEQGRRVVFPYVDGAGKTRNVKYRSISKKRFDYAEQGEDIFRLWYGMDVVYRLRPTTVVLCEAEIDAMTWHSSKGLVGISSGNASVSEDQIELLLKLGVENFVLSYDADDVGKKVVDKLIKILYTKGNLFTTAFRGEHDANDCWVKTGKAPQVFRVEKGVVRL